MNGKSALVDDTLAPSYSTAVVAVFLAWLFPGAGHLFLGRKARAAVFCLVVLASFLTGLWLQGMLPVSLSGSPLAIIQTLACMCLGLPYFVVRFVSDYTSDPSAAGFEYGLAFIRTAGVMNLLLILDVWDLARGRKP